MVYVYASTQKAADVWTRAQGLRPSEVRTFGTASKGADGLVFTAADRLVVLGHIDDRLHSMLRRNRRKAPDAPEIEYVAAVVES